MGIDDTDLSTRLPNMISIDARTFRVPIVGRVAAGRPIVADEEIIGYEYIDNKYSKDGHEYFGLRIVGKSMEPTIMDGDIVIVRRQNYVENGEIAIVLIDGEEATAKEVKESADGITLIGHNTAVYTPHFYSAQEVKNLPVQIIGRVVQSIRKF
ncbi:S24 family peptidase [uncultured Selenomonas sp.]|uniref:LexA family protein n=1 Tax=uncultured Selenomonas sp. TaxID=159275 RepID=UPI0028059AEA|nr:S24 family peptidase [uncultured Selenomonas sp.]